MAKLKLSLLFGFALAAMFAISCSGADGSDGEQGLPGAGCRIEAPGVGAPANAAYELFCGDTGKSYYIYNGEQGPAGADGNDGVDGGKGDKGDKGDGCVLTKDERGDYLISCGSGSTIVLNMRTCGNYLYDSEGKFCDERDGKVYRFVEIGGQVWMAENLNYYASGSKCYGDEAANCERYGRLYDWDTAMVVCPAGWHLPSDEEWTTLTDFVGGAATAGTKLKASSGWNSYSGIPAGTDDYGFAALPGGRGISDGGFSGAGNYGNWWSSSEYSASGAYSRNMNYLYEDVSRFYIVKTYLFSVRCLQDSAP